MALWFESALLADGWANGVRIDIADGRVKGIERNVRPHPGDESHFVALPGLSNVHSHAFQRGMAGLTEYRGSGTDNFWTWRELMYRFLDRVTPQDVSALASQAYAEMLESGFTRVAEFHYLHHAPDGRPYANSAEMAERIAEASAETGIGLTLLPVYYAQSGFGGLPPEHGQRRFITNPSQFAALYEQSRLAIRRLEDAKIGVAPHSLRAVTREDLQKIVELAPDGPIHIHAAEQVKEVEDCIAWCGRRPVEWLLDEMQVDTRWCLIHSTHLTSGETTRLAQSGAVAGLCPITEANLGDGIFPSQSYFAAGGRIGIGTDSNILIDAAEELRAIEYAQRLSLRVRNALGGGAHSSTGRALFDAALKGGAQAAGLLPLGIAAGASADFVTLSSSHPSLAARSADALLDSWIFAAGRAAIDTVWRRGTKLVEGGRHIRAHAINGRYQDTLKRLLAA